MNNCFQPHVGCQPIWHSHIGLSQSAKPPCVTANSMAGMQVSSYCYGQQSHSPVINCQVATALSPTAHINCTRHQGAKGPPQASTPRPWSCLKSLGKKGKARSGHTTTGRACMPGKETVCTCTHATGQTSRAASSGPSTRNVVDQLAVGSAAELAGVVLRTCTRARAHVE